MTFEEFGLSEDVMRGLDAMNFKEATPVQEQTIPVILQKRDLIACAQTGTGKTAAYILPLLNLLTEKQGDGDRVRAVIVAPTRELAQQIDMQFEGFSYFLPISTVVVSGGGDGASWDQQKRGLTMGADIIIATPGRLISHLNISNIDFSGVECFILDEADRMLDMGFYDDIMKIGKKLPDNRQTVMFSATMPPKIRPHQQHCLYPEAGRHRHAAEHLPGPGRLYLPGNGDRGLRRIRQCGELQLRHRPSDHSAHRAGPVRAGV